jgi:hypothetical protein
VSASGTIAIVGVPYAGGNIIERAATARYP